MAKYDKEWYKRNREKKIKQSKERYRNLSKEEKEKLKQKSNEYYWKHRNEILEKQKIYQSNYKKGRRTDPEKFRDYIRKLLKEYYDKKMDK